jgi:hypothetical protein
MYNKHNITNMMAVLMSFVPLEMSLFQEQVQITESENVVKVQSDQPHLVSVGSGRFSTAVTILPLQQGK